MLGLKLFPLLLAAFAGAVMAVQGAVNALMGKIAGLCLATFIVHAVGTAFAGLLLLFTRGSFSRLTQAPWYAWIGGLRGVLIIYSVCPVHPQGWRGARNDRDHLRAGADSDANRPFRSFRDDPPSF